jgi:AcrR family transcriptional regulator
MGRVTKAAIARRQEITECAKALFVKNGFDKTQVSDIASALGVSQGLVYHYFASKRDLFYEVVNEIASEHEDRMERLFLSTDATAYEKLSSFMRKSMEMEGYGELIPSVCKDQGALEFVTKRFALSAVSRFAGLIEEGNRDGSWDCPQPSAAAEFIMAGLGGLSKEKGWNCPPEERKAALSFALRVLGADAKRNFEGMESEGNAESNE